MQLVEQFNAVDEQHQVHTVSVYKKTPDSSVYWLDGRELVEPLEDRWFVTQAGDVLERVMVDLRSHDSAPVSGT